MLINRSPFFDVSTYNINAKLPPDLAFFTYNVLSHLCSDSISTMLALNPDGGGCICEHVYALHACVMMHDDCFRIVAYSTIQAIHLHGMVRVSMHGTSKDIRAWHDICQHALKPDGGGWTR